MGEGGGVGGAVLTGGMPVENMDSQHVGVVPTGPNANGARGHEGAFGLTPGANEQVGIFCGSIRWNKSCGML